MIGTVVDGDRPELPDGMVQNEMVSQKRSGTPTGTHYSEKGLVIVGCSD
jgi:hypothetical protein